MRKILSRLLAIAAFLPGVATAETAFAPGQVWSLSGAYPQARVLIGRVETLGGDPIVHVTVLDARLSGTNDELPLGGNIGHMPFAEEALRHSVDRLLEEHHAPFEQFEGGYQQWKEANGGVFTITVAEGIDVARETFVRGRAAGKFEQ